MTKTLREKSPSGLRQHDEAERDDLRDADGDATPGRASRDAGVAPDTGGRARTGTKREVARRTSRTGSVSRK